MITYLLVLILLGLVTGVTYPIRALPDVSLPADLTNAIAKVSGSIGILRVVLPYTVAAVFLVLTIFLAVEAAIYAYLFIKWAYKKIPGIN